LTTQNPRRPKPTGPASVADPDPGSGDFLTPGSGIIFFRLRDE
jgi:hypothetical protein